MWAVVLFVRKHRTETCWSEFYEITGERFPDISQVEKDKHCTVICDDKQEYECHVLLVTEKQQQAKKFEYVIRCQMYKKCVLRVNLGLCPGCTYRNKEKETIPVTLRSECESDSQAEVQLASATVPTRKRRIQSTQSSNPPTRLSSGFASTFQHAAIMAKLDTIQAAIQSCHRSENNRLDVMQSEFEKVHQRNQELSEQLTDMRKNFERLTDVIIKSAEGKKQSKKTKRPLDDQVRTQFDNFIQSQPSTSGFNNAQPVVTSGLSDTSSQSLSQSRELISSSMGIFDYENSDDSLNIRDYMPIEGIILEQQSPRMVLPVGSPPLGVPQSPERFDRQAIISTLIRVGFMTDTDGTTTPFASPLVPLLPPPTPTSHTPCHTCTLICERVQTVSKLDQVPKNAADCYFIGGVVETGSKYPVSRCWFEGKYCVKCLVPNLQNTEEAARQLLAKVAALLFTRREIATGTPDTTITITNYNGVRATKIPMCRQRLSALCREVHNCFPAFAPPTGRDNPSPKLKYWLKSLSRAQLVRSSPNTKSIVKLAGN